MTRKGVLVRPGDYPIPSWSWADVVQDQQENPGRHFLYVYRCSAGCGEDVALSAVFVGDCVAGGVQGRCPSCHDAKLTPRFWEIQQPIADVTVADGDAEGWRVRLYVIDKLEYYDLTQAVVTRTNGDRYVTGQYSLHASALADAFAHVSGDILRKVENSTP